MNLDDKITIRAGNESIDVPLRFLIMRLCPSRLIALQTLRFKDTTATNLAEKSAQPTSGARVLQLLLLAVHAV